MAASRKYDQETRDRAVRMYRERRRDTPAESEVGSRRRVGELLDIPADTLRGWVRQADIDDGVQPGVSTQESAEMRELRKEIAELRRANEILKTASAFFASAELDRRLK